LTGIVGIVLSTHAMLSDEPESISHLVHGSQVQTWRLQPMRDAGLLALTEVPRAWHDESPRRDGTRACALTARGVAVLTDSARSVPFDAVTHIEATPRTPGGLTVDIHGPAGTATCAFAAGEGGERFVRQIQVERQGGDQSP